MIEEEETAEQSIRREMQGRLANIMINLKSLDLIMNVLEGIEDDWERFEQAVQFIDGTKTLSSLDWIN